MKVVHIRSLSKSALNAKTDSCVVKRMYFNQRPVLSSIKLMILQHAGIIA